MLPGEMAGLAERAEAKNLVTIYAALAGVAPGTVLAQFAGQGFGAFKPALADLAVATLAPIRRAADGPAGRPRGGECGAGRRRRARRGTGRPDAGAKAQAAVGLQV